MNQSIKSHGFVRLFLIRITIAVTLILILICYTTLPNYAQNSAEEYFYSGVEKANSGDYQEAIEEFDKAIKINPKDAKAYYNRGVVKGGLGDYRGAIEDFNKSIEINPMNTNPYYTRGRAKARLSNYSEAIKDFNEVIDRNPEDLTLIKVCIDRGSAKYNLGDYRGAIEDFNKAIEINSKYAKTYYGRGLAKIGLDQKDSGCLDLSKAGELGYSEAYEAIKELCN